MFHLPRDQIFQYLEDIGAVACSARGIVSSADWAANVEQFCPGAIASLPGDPKFQARALRRRGRFFLWRDAHQLARERDIACVFQVSQGQNFLWRGTGLLARPHHHHFCVLEAEVTLPCTVAEIIEAEINRWCDLDTFEQQTLRQFDVASSLQLWIPAHVDNPVVFQPNLTLQGVRSYVVTVEPGCCGRVALATFLLDICAPDDSSGTSYSFVVHVRVYRPDRQLRKMDGPITGSAILLIYHHQSASVITSSAS